MEDSKQIVSKPFGHMPASGAVTNKQKPGAEHKKRTFHNKHLIIALVGCCAVILWIVLFSMGMLIDSKPYRTSLGTDFTIYSLIMSILAFTPTNIAILCLVSAFTGGCASLLVVSKAERALGWEKQENVKPTDSHIYMNENPFSSMLRGLLVFFAFLAGVFVTSSTAIISPTPEAYTQAAGVVSMLAFIVGYDPTLFRGLISIGEKFKGGGN